MSKPETSVELLDPVTGDYEEVIVTFEYDTTPAEREGEYQYWNGTVTMTGYKVTPFDFMGKHYTDLPPELFEPMSRAFNPRFIESHGQQVIEAAALWDQEKKACIESYLNWLFTEYVEPDIDVGTKQY